MVTPIEGTDTNLVAALLLLVYGHMSWCSLASKGTYNLLCAVPIFFVVPLQAVSAPQLQVKFVPGENYGLPEGWAVEEKPRTTVKGRCRTDKYCHHIPTGKRFRSLSDANKWIKEETTREQAHGTSKDGDESCSPAQSSTRRIRRKGSRSYEESMARNCSMCGSCQSSKFMKLENDSDLVHGLLEVEGAPVGS